MPLINVVVNKEAGLDAKKTLAKAITELFAAECRVPASHVHVVILDNQFISFGADSEKAAAYITVKSSQLQILPEARRSLVSEIVPALKAVIPDLDGYRINTFFEDLPVENIAIGPNIATFSKPGGGRGSAGGGGGSIGGASDVSAH
ncbi:hypothetical protein Agub_g2376 [Astrephomene gubernaculifera]|uniref:Macrophage migration inhibitory factor n=1 Tax=Astrephomene gubernaculifera TaxID=47775 RepID=A0AAD3DKN9_9CHLO|nr:hypothetical protein Agub_g2376 [Astrephomene gubernaculifera]